VVRAIELAKVLLEEKRHLSLDVLLVGLELHLPRKINTITHLLGNGRWRHP
jgi:hypothetical protein